MRWLTNFYDFRFRWIATAGIGIHPTKAWLSQLVNFKNAIWTGKKCHRNVWNASDCFWSILHESSISYWVFEGVQEEIPSEEASTLQIGSVAFPPGQCTCPQLHLCHRLFDEDGHQDTLPIVQTLLPVTFGYSLSSEAVVMRQLRRWKRLWRRSLTRSHKRTSMGIPKVVGTVQQVQCSRRRLEFHVCTVNKSAHTKKVGKLIVCTSYNYYW